MTKQAAMTADDGDGILAALAALAAQGGGKAKATDAVTVLDVVQSGDGLANLQAVAGRAGQSDVVAVAGAVQSLTVARLRAFAEACETMAAELEMSKIRVSTRDGIKCTTTVMVRWVDRAANSDRDSWSALNFSMPEAYAPVFAPSAKRNPGPVTPAVAGPVSTRKAK
jgi:hypothetical protein